MNPRLALILLALALPAARPKSWDFDAAPLGATPPGFTAEVGRWEIVEDGGARVLAQLASNPDKTFNVALSDVMRKDVDISVRLKAIEGELDRGGGLAWRATDRDNYYLARYNPLEDNFRVYKVEGGKRTQFATADIPRPKAGLWHTLRVRMAGDRITCDLDGERYLDVKDSTFPGAGKVGLWTKSDARTHFHDLKDVEPAPGASS